jgi:hypothetical protein
MADFYVGCIEEEITDQSNWPVPNRIASNLDSDQLEVERFALFKFLRKNQVK